MRWFGWETCGSLGTNPLGERRYVVSDSLLPEKERGRETEREREREIENIFLFRTYGA